MHTDLADITHAEGYKLLTNLVVPRPIAWVTSLDAQRRVNLAPFSYFNLIGSEPSLVVISVGDGPDDRPKDTARNIELTRDFVVNLVTEELVGAMNVSAADFPSGESELVAAGLHAEASVLVKSPRVREAKASLECKLHNIQRIGGEQYHYWGGVGGEYGGGDGGGAFSCAWLCAAGAVGDAIGILPDDGSI